MARHARIKSSTGIYHVMIRGINKEKVFIKDIHKTKLLEIINDIKREIEFSIIAYCIMDNHLHLLVKDKDDNLAVVMKKLSVKYAMFYNKVQDRYGYVFQNRFKSEAVENENYLLYVIRYIHNNPVKANITKNLLDYKWSSINDYINDSNKILCDVYKNMVLEYFKTKNEFIKFHSIYDTNLYIDTIEEEQENINNIVQYMIDKYTIKNGITESKEFTQNHRENLAISIINLHMITLNEVAGLCNLSLNKVKELNKSIKNHESK